MTASGVVDLPVGVFAGLPGHVRFVLRGMAVTWTLGALLVLVTDASFVARVVAATGIWFGGFVLGGDHPSGGGRGPLAAWNRVFQRSSPWARIAIGAPAVLGGAVAWIAAAGAEDPLARVAAAIASFVASFVFGGQARIEDQDPPRPDSRRRRSS